LEKSVSEKLKFQALKLLPKNIVSRAFGAISEVQIPRPLRSAVNGGFAWYAGIDLSESAQPPGDFSSLNAFFTRRLKDEVHQIDSSAHGEAVSPVDGRLGMFGRVENDMVLQAKGRGYSLKKLFDSADDAATYRDGTFITVYLSPRDYHRVHSPISGTVKRVTYIPGQLFPVNPVGVRFVDDLFAVNERLVVHMETEELGAVAVIMVGATCVGRMTLAFHGVSTNGRWRQRSDHFLERDVRLKHGDELGRFNLGSTVILVFQDSGFTADSSFEFGQALRLGKKLGGKVSEGAQA
jgi:phosphatidylserine decarboxylase